MLYLKNAMLFVAVVGVVSILIECSASAPAAQTQESSADLAEATGEDIFDGLVLPEVDCAKCHVDGGGAPDLFGRVDDLSDEDIITILEEGKGEMPSFSDKLMENEQQKIIQCLRARFGEPEEDTEESDAASVSEPEATETPASTDSPASE